MISFSFIPSNELVASSRIISCGCKTNILAKPIRCLCPPDKFLPPDEITVCNPNGIFLMSSYIFAFFKALIITSSEIELSPRVILYFILPLKSFASCGITPIIFFN